MKILLLHPPPHPEIRGILPPQVEESRGAFPPLGLLYLAAAVRAELPEIEVRVLDAPTSGDSPDAIAAYVARENFDLVGMTVMSFTLLGALAAARAIKAARPATTIIAGGPHPHLYPRETLGLGPFDEVLRGEAELSFVELLRRKLRGEPPAGVPGWGEAPCAEFIADLDRLPFPDRERLPIAAYHSVLSGLRPITTMISSRGCPYQCIFCDRPHLGKSFRSRSAANVLDEMERCRELGVREIVFYDDNLTHDRGRAMQIAQGILDRRLDLAWDVRARVGDLDQDAYRLAAAAGLRRIHFGVESGNPDLLRSLRKGITLDQARRAFAQARQAGIETLAYFMVGLPGETAASLQQTLEFARELDPDYIHFSVLICFPGTPVYTAGREQGVIPGDPWREFAAHPSPDFAPPLWVENLTPAELLDALRRLYRAFYLRPGYLLRRASRIRSWQSLRNHTRMGLSILGLRP